MNCGGPRRRVARAHTSAPRCSQVLHQLRWHFLEKPRRHARLRQISPISPPVNCAGQNQSIHCARHAHIAQPPFFLDIIRMQKRSRVREQTFLQSAQKYEREFQSLSCMQRHQRDLCPFVISVRVAHQRCVIKELIQRFASISCIHRCETLDQFLDHAALVSDADAYDERAQITLMTLHAAKGLEFSLVFLCGLEEGLFPHSRTFLHPDDIEEERRLCYVGMTRAMDALILTRAVYRRRYGTDLPDASVPSRFLEEVPAELMENLGTPRRARVSAGDSPARATAVHGERESGHYAYEDEDQSVSWGGRNHRRSQTPSYSGKTYNSIDNIAEFFASRGKKFSMSRLPVEEPKGRRGFRPGQKVKHPKYGEGTVYQREGEGEEAKITVQFPRFGLKKLVEKYAPLERA